MYGSIKHGVQFLGVGNLLCLKGHWCWFAHDKLDIVSNTEQGLHHLRQRVGNKWAAMLIQNLANYEESKAPYEIVEVPKCKSKEDNKKNQEEEQYEKNYE
uniref:Uncharacterized protein n=1 Tax=Romanomermis culicivorax TaxID=13658 RepID=A0A915HN57_ROMCU